MRRRALLRSFAGATASALGGAVGSALAQTAVVPAYPLGKRLSLADVDALIPAAPRLPSSAFQAIAFYYPSWHRSGSRGSEWDQLFGARSLRLDDKQPVVPKWGTYDNADPKWAAQEIDAAKGAGIRSFFTYFYYNNGRVIMDEQLRDGELKAPNAADVSFALAWSNYFRYGPIDYKNYDYGKMIDYVIKNFISKPNYWRIDNVPVFGLTEVPTMLKAIGPEGTRKALSYLRSEVARAGHRGLYFIACQEHHAQMRSLGIDGATNFQAFDAGRAGTIGFAEAAIKAIRVWQTKAGSLDVPYFPDCPVGWNNSPRMQRRSDRLFLVANRDAQQYAVFVEAAKRFIEQQRISPRLIFLSSWNEWTEGHYLLPDETFGDSYLKSLRHELVGG